LLWLLAVGLAFAAAWQRSDPSTVKLTEPITRGEVIILIAIVALAFALRAIDLEHIPGVVLGDETKYAVAARYLTEHQQIKPFTTGSDGHWNFYLQIIGLFLQLCGQTITAMRLPSVLAGTLGIVALYAVVRQLWGRRPALIAAALMATYHQNIHYSRVGFNSIDDPLFLALVFACVWLAWRTGRRRAWLMTALAVGLSQYFFVGGRLVLLQLGALAVFWLITDRRRVRAQALNIALAISVFACIITPILYFWAVHPDDYMASLNTKNIYRSGWLAATAEATKQDYAEVLWGQLRDVLTSFSFGSDEGFYWAQPMLTPLMSILAVIGLAYCVAHSREGPYFWIVSSLALVILFGGILMVSPTAGSHRLLG
ncbi:MAG TPA: glycosyltransferase family 39 protein, partial [Anaerolineae bacterium]